MMEGLRCMFDEPETDEPWPIDPKDKDPQNEETRQMAFLRRAVMHCPAVDIFAVPNGAKRSQWAAMKAKREGMKAGAPDLVCTWENQGVAFIEFKDGQKMPDAKQRARLNMHYRQRHPCGVFRTADSALLFLQKAGAPFVFPP